jgi:hypothetical protein
MLCVGGKTGGAIWFASIFCIKAKGGKERIEELIEK